MPKNNKSSKTTPQNKKTFVTIIVLVILLVVAVGVILFMLLFSNTTHDMPNAEKDNASGIGHETSDDKSELSESDYGKNNPIIMITDRNTPISASEEDGYFVQTAEVNMYCDLQGGYEISNTGKAYKGNKPTTSQMEYDSSQTYHKYSQYGSVGLICYGSGKYKKNDKWELYPHYVKVDNANITDEGRFTFTDEAWLNPDGSTKEFRDFANKTIMITSEGHILEKYNIKMHFILNREAQDFLDSWRKTIDAR